VPLPAHVLQVVETGSFQAAVAENEAAGLDDIGFETQAGTQAQQRATVLRDVGLEEC
jgi:hypothetical protein